MNGSWVLLSLLPLVLLTLWHAILAFERLHHRPPTTTELLARFTPTEPLVWLRHDPSTLARERLLAEARRRGFEEYDCCSPDADGSQLLVFRRA